MGHLPCTPRPTMMGETRIISCCYISFLPTSSCSQNSFGCRHVRLVDFNLEAGPARRGLARHAGAGPTVGAAGYGLAVQRDGRLLSGLFCCFLVLSLLLLGSFWASLAHLLMQPVQGGSQQPLAGSPPGCGQTRRCRRSRARSEGHARGRSRGHGRSRNRSSRGEQKAARRAA